MNIIAKADQQKVQRWPDTHVSDGFSHNSKEPEAEPDSTYGGKSIRELYELASTNYCGNTPVHIMADFIG